MKVLYDDVIELRNRLSLDGSGETYQEDHLLLDRVLDLLEKEIELYKTPQERLFDLGFEKVAKHKYVKVNKGGSGYNTPYKITIEFAFNMYQVKCECENWVGVDIELAEVLVDYLKELENE